MDEFIISLRKTIEDIQKNIYKKADKKLKVFLIISKFVLTKEKIIKKDTTDNSLYFDNIVNQKYINSILLFVQEIKKNCSYKINKTTIHYRTDNNTSKELNEALWFLNKIRDSLVHQKYKIDFEENLILINNDRLENKNNAFKLVCSIPIDLLDKMTASIPESNKDFISLNLLLKDYINNINSINTEFNTHNILYKNSEMKFFYNFIETQTKLNYKTIFNKTNYNFKNPNNYYEDIKISKNIDEISQLLNIETDKAGELTLLYTYISLIFSNITNIDFAHLNLEKFNIIINPYKNNYKFEKLYNMQNYDIENLCNIFIKNSNEKLNKYYKNQTKGLKYSLMYTFSNFYTSLINYIGNKKKIIITSIRNAIEHGNYLYINNKIYLYDMTEQQNKKSIKFICSVFPNDLFTLAKSIEENRTKNNYKIENLLNDLNPVFNDKKRKTFINILNKYSIIIFDKELKFQKSVEQMYQEKIIKILKNTKK